MNKEHLLKNIKNCNKVILEKITTIFKNGKLIQVARDSSGKFVRKGSSIGDRERRAYRQTQSAEAGPQQRKRQKRSTRRGTISSRERRQIRQSASGRLGSEVSMQRREKGHLGALRSQLHGEIKKFKHIEKHPVNITRALHREYGNNIPESIKISKRQEKKIRKIIQKLRMGRKRNKGKRRRGRRR